MPIQKITTPELLIPQFNNNGKAQEIKESFSEMLGNALQDVNRNILESEKLTQDFVLGKNVELHQVVLANEQASLALQMTIQVRNKVIEAYQEIMRMQV